MGLRITSQKKTLEKTEGQIENQSASKKDIQTVKMSCLVQAELNTHNRHVLSDHHQVNTFNSL